MGSKKSRVSQYEEELSRLKLGDSSRELDNDHRNQQDISMSTLNRESPADLQPLGFRRHRNPGVFEGSQQPPASMARIREKLLKNGGSNGAANASTIESVVRGVLGSIDRVQFEEYLKNPPYIKLMKRGKNLKQFRRLFLAQELRIQDDNVNENEGVTRRSQSLDAKAIWVNKFSLDGKYMAVGSKDGSIWIWKVLSSPVERWEMDYKEEIHKAIRRKKSVLQRHHHSHLSPNGNINLPRRSGSRSGSTSTLSKKGQKLAEKSEKETARLSATNLYAPVFQPHPFRVYREHESSVLDLDWSPNGFLISASMDKTAVLWHIERDQSLKTFFHPDFVTCIGFYPLDDRFFVTGCLDHKCRMWSILDDEVIFVFDCGDLITSMVLTPDVGKYTIIGTFNGYIYVLETQGLHLVSFFHVTDKESESRTNVESPSSHSKNHHGPKVTCLQCFGPPNEDSLKLMTVSNDSRIRIFDLSTKRCVEVLRGFESGASQHNAQLITPKSHTVVISGSNDHWVYGWKLNSVNSPTQKSEKDTTFRHSVSIKTSGSIKNFLNKNKGKRGPEPSSIKTKQDNNSDNNHRHRIHNPLKSIVRHSNSSDHPYVKNNYSISFHAHHSPITTAIIAPSETSKALSLSNDLICELSLLLYENDDQLRLFGEPKKTSRRTDNNNSDDSDIEGSDFEVSPDSSIAHNSPNAVDAIGTIMITTDTTGLVRIFRADMPSPIRRRVLDGLEAPQIQFGRPYKNKFGSVDSLTSVQNFAKPGVTVRPSSFHAGTSASELQTVNGDGDDDLLVSRSLKDPFNQCKPLQRGSIFRHALSNQSTSSNEGSLKRHSIACFPGETDRTRLMATRNSSLGPRPCCDVCGSTKFNMLPRGSFSGRENGYYCADCSTINNNFR